MKIGSKVILTIKHPYAGETGIYIEDGETLFGIRPIIQLDKTGQKVCVMREEQWRKLK